MTATQKEIVVSIRLPADIKKKVEDLAKKANRTFAGQVREILQKATTRP